MFHLIFEIGGGGGGYIQKTMHFVLNFYSVCNKKKCTFRCVFILKNRTFCATFLSAKHDALFVTFLYPKYIVYFILVPKYKSKYDQSDQIDK